MEDRHALFFLERIRLDDMKPPRKLFYRIFEAFESESPAPSAVVLCLDHGFMLELITMARDEKAKLSSLADDLLTATLHTYIVTHTVEEGEVYARMGFHCSTVNYRIKNPQPEQPDVDFQPTLEAAFDTREKFLEWISVIYGRESIYDIMLTGGRFVSMRDDAGLCVTVISTSPGNERWVVGKAFDGQGNILQLTTARFAAFMKCILSSLPKGEEVVYTYHQFEGGNEAMWLLQNGWLPESFEYARSKSHKGVTNAN
ncbi:hypothetical protein G173_gp030 [Erwinia phage phiEaH2]|uniref:Uncharacterized protein n=1 Tax=Erwinia phage phiEaH2 TaxID=1029988 RepID=J7KKF1_9CAUD|nr:hypothetical protein G173_gp030 [Erwinia phage phiEaH2]AFQ96575.1 hypothetical protein [Erwinia phage phiEaH2]